jgi:hypothetical protein
MTGNTVAEASGMATRATPFFSWITTQADRTEHAVLDEAHVAGMEAGTGRYESLRRDVPGRVHGCRAVSSVPALLGVHPCAG